MSSQQPQTGIGDNEHGEETDDRDAIDRPRQTPARFDRYIGALLATAPMLPGLAGVSTIIAYIVARGDNPDGDVGWVSLLIALGVALGLWLLFPLFHRRFAVADRANTGSYYELCEQVDLLNARLKHLRPPASSGSCPDPITCVAYAEADTCLKAAKRVLEGTGKRDEAVPWVLGTGYISTWSLVHRAEEALIDLEPCETVIAGALYDEMRLLGLAITNNDSLLTKLRKAVRDLSAPATKYLDKTSETSENDRSGTDTNQGGNTNSGTNPGEVERQARAVLRVVRHTINRFRDDRRDGLVRARNRLVRALLFTGLTSYLLLVLAIRMQSEVEPPEVVAGTAFYLVGAIVGLFARLRTEARSDHAIEDFGLSTARLIHTPLLSGLAAIGGVALVVTLTEEGQWSAVTMSDIFSLSPYTLILAAVFGLTPGLLIDRLKQQTDEYKTDLRSSEATSGVDRSAAR